MDRFACLRHDVHIQVIGQNKTTDWPKLGPSLLIATALVVAIRTSRCAAKAAVGANVSDVDLDLDREIAFAVRVSDRVLNALLRKRPCMFRNGWSRSLQRMTPTCRGDGGDCILLPLSSRFVCPDLCLPATPTIYDRLLRNPFKRPMNSGLYSNS